MHLHITFTGHSSGGCESRWAYHPFGCTYGHAAVLIPFYALGVYVDTDTGRSTRCCELDTELQHAFNMGLNH